MILKTKLLYLDDIKCNYNDFMLLNIYCIQVKKNYHSQIIDTSDYYLEEFQLITFFFCRILVLFCRIFIFLKKRFD